MYELIQLFEPRGAVLVRAGHMRLAADEAYTGSLVEFGLLGLSCGLGMLTYALPPRLTFSCFAAPACAAALVLCMCARFPPPPLGAAPMSDADDADGETRYRAAPCGER